MIKQIKKKYKESLENPLEKNLLQKMSLFNVLLSPGKGWLSNNEIFRRDSPRLSFNKTIYQLNTIFSLPLSSQTHLEVKLNGKRERKRRVNGNTCVGVSWGWWMAVVGWDGLVVLYRAQVMLSVHDIRIPISIAILNFNCPSPIFSC